MPVFGDEGSGGAIWNAGKPPNCSGAGSSLVSLAVRIVR